MPKLISAVSKYRKRDREHLRIGKHLTAIIP